MPGASDRGVFAPVFNKMRFNPASTSENTLPLSSLRSDPPQIFFVALKFATIINGVGICKNMSLSSTVTLGKIYTS